MTSLNFIKMHGLGNDFVVFDSRAEPLTLSADQTRAIADRRTGIGCDQLIQLEPATDAGADIFMRIRNADGGEVDACGNATRCIGAMVMAETGQDQAVIQTNAGLLATTRTGGNLVTVDMGPAKLDWQDIPLAGDTDTLHLDMTEGDLSDPVAVSMGNPHAVFFVPHADAIALSAVGPKLEHHPLYPERTNVEVVEVRRENDLRVRVWERGAGITMACGTGACAALVAAHRRGLAGRTASVELDGGILDIEWQENGHVLMTGETAVCFTGAWTL